MILCKLFGHKTPKYWFNLAYADVRQIDHDNINRTHWIIEYKCDRCAKRFPVARIHGTNIENNFESPLIVLCKKFVADNKITCEETVYQTDRVIENAYEFITNICELVGYDKRND